ncbi:hypothetical protein THTE_4156 [Thermogutta terrifontis]|uniref:DUF5666 domain-containing protein n=1 Tax=Thermogutta terrifontis TaxID=1331910 RepID=A0A286RLH6_9BACT|nr:hypothetical protein [Thermogutta terrifontis]ASV76757.1 hypothetical protein THTE_4156 [Thermogutta terrifontis]
MARQILSRAVSRGNIVSSRLIGGASKWMTLILIVSACFWGCSQFGWAQLPPPGVIPPHEGGGFQRPGMVPQYPGPMRGNPLPGQRPGGQPQLPRLEASGTVEEVGPMGMVIVSPTGQKWQLLFDRECKLQLTGKAMPDVLRPGVVISFTAEIDKKTGQATEKVSAVTICTPDQQHLLGVFPEGTMAAMGEAADAGAGAAGVGGFPGSGFGSGLAPEGGAPPQQPGRQHSRRQVETGPPVERFEVCGRITGITKTGKITVAAPNHHFRAPIQFELAENPDISLELSGREAVPFIARGAKVTGKGVQIAPTAGRMSEITVELVEPLTLTQKREPRNGTHRTVERTPERLPGSLPGTLPGGAGAHKPDAAPASQEKPGPEGGAGNPPSDQEPPKKAAGIDLPPLNN